MPSAIETSEIKLKQLIPPRPQPTRGKPFPLDSFGDWFIYPQGKNVYLYHLKDKSLSKGYREHAYPVGVSKFSPTGNFIASGDQSGNLRVWSTETLETKLELKALGGRINDLQWSEDEKYIALCGEGRDLFANVVKVDGGASFGELTGPSKSCQSVALRSSHILLASDDKSLTIYRATPTFKFVRTLRDHENFVQVVRFSGDGKMFASAGADGKLFIYSIENYNMICQFKAHETGILAMEWIDGNTIITASSDKSLKLWRVPEGSLLCQSEVSKDWTFEKQICGINLVNTDIILVLRLDGSMEFRDQAKLTVTDSTSLNGIGHSKGIVDLLSDGVTIHSVSYDGNMKTWQKGNDSTYQLTSEFNFASKNVQKLGNSRSAISENKLVTQEGEEIGLSGKIVGYGKEKAITFDGNLFSNGQILKKFGCKVELACFNNCNSNSSNYVLSTGTSLQFYDPTDQMIKSFDDISSKITSLAFNNSASSLATADDQRRIKIYTIDSEGGNNWTRQPSQWCDHAARIDTLQWLTDEILLSAGVDGNILAWSLPFNKIGPIRMIKSAHSGPVNKLTKLGDDEFASGASGDSCIKIWSW